MAISFVDGGANLISTLGTRTVDYPTTTTSGNLLILVVTNKDGADLMSTTLTGWTFQGQVAGGAGSDATIDEGTGAITVFTKVADGTEGGTSQSITVSSGTKPLTAKIYQYTNGTGEWATDVETKAQNSGGSATWSVTTSAELTITAGDLIFVASCINGDAYSFSAQALTTTGVTYGTATERTDLANNNGNDNKLMASQHEVSSGSSGGNNTTYQATASGSATNAPAGATILLRLREAPAGLSITSVTPSSFDDGHTGITITGSGFGVSQGSSTVTIGGQAQTITSWSATSIQFTAVRGSNSMGANTLTVTVV